MLHVVANSTANRQPVSREFRFDPAEGIKLINSIDLSMVKLKLMSPNEGEGWTQSVADAIELRYRRFLCMILLVGDDTNVAPTKDIDAFWHQHILDTRAYAADCNRIFGKFIHHFPYAGMRGKEDAAHHQSCFDDTQSLYFKLFGEPYVAPSEKSLCYTCIGPSVMPRDDETASALLRQLPM